MHNINTREISTLCITHTNDLEKGAKSQKTVGSKNYSEIFQTPENRTPIQCNFLSQSLTSNYLTFELVKLGRVFNVCTKGSEHFLLLTFF